MWFRKRRSKKQKRDPEEVWNSLRERARPMIRPAVLLRESETQTQSWFGGRPFVDPESFVWPLHQGRPLSFIAQICLEEVSEQHRFDWLPEKGSLLFFWDLVDFPMGTCPENRTGWLVAYVETPKDFAEPPIHHVSKVVVDNKQISFQRAEPWPCLISAEIQELDLSDEEADVYIEESCAPLEGALGQIGGYPSPIQDYGLERECELSSKGQKEDYGQFSSMKDRHKVVKTAAAEWKLLLQLDEDIYGGFNMFYFFVKKSDAIQKHFDRAWRLYQYD